MCNAKKIDDSPTARRRGVMMMATMALCAGAPATARAATIAHEGFSYTYTAVDTDALNGKTGGSGWAAAWSASPSTSGAGSGAYLAAQDLAYTGLGSVDRAVKMGRSGWSQPGGNDGGAVATRLLDLSRVNPALLSNGKLGADGTTLWIAFTAQGYNWFNGNAGNKIGLSLTSGGVEKLSIGANGAAQSTGGWVLTPNLGNASGEVPILPADTSVHLFVAQIAFLAGSESVTVWADPQIGGLGPAGGTEIVNASFPSFTFDGIMLQSNRNDAEAVFDEIRVGTDFPSVVDNIPIRSQGTLVEETFAYAYTAVDTNPLNSASGGAGWAAPWTSSPTVAGRGAGAYLDGTDMEYSGIAPFGYAAKIGRNGWSQAGGNDGGGVATRPIDVNRVHPSLLQGGRLGADNTTLWLAFTARGSNWFNGNAGNKIGLSLTSGGVEKLSIGANGAAETTGAWVLTPHLGNASGEVPILPAAAAVHLFVAQVAFLAGNEQVTVWGDPQIGGTSPTGGTEVANLSFPDFTFDGIMLQSNRNDAEAVFDDVRVGTTFSSVVGRERELHIVAHQDDDVLFMNPDLSHSIGAGNVIQTVYVTDGEGNRYQNPDGTYSGDPNYIIDRQDGLMAAYAQMAGETNDWSCKSMTVAGKTMTHCTLDDHVSLVFLHLRSGNGFTFDYCSTSSCGDPCGWPLSYLWSTPGCTVTDTTTLATYTRQDLLNVLEGHMQQLVPSRVSAQETGLVYGYDHIEHDLAGLFALEAHQAYAGQHVFVRYRDYDITDDPSNLSAADTSAKQATFQWYAACDSYICGSFDGTCGAAQCDAGTSYAGYYSRQYPNYGIAPGSWSISTTGGSVCLTTNAAGVGVATCASGPAQTWTLNTQHQLVSSGGQCLSSSGQGETAVWLDTCAAVPQQRWTPLDSGLILGEAGECLMLNGSAIQVADCSLTDAQRWALASPP